MVIAEDTLRVRVHNATDMTWYGAYSDTSIFPSDTFSFRKILMHYTMGCATGGCSDWDYTTTISALLNTNQLDTNGNIIREPFELGRVITPYGSGLNQNWKYTHTFDVSDFATILKDTLPIQAFYSGWSSGFSVTLDFEFIIGTPQRNVLAIQNIYQGSWDYINPTEFEINNLPPKKILVDSAKGALLRVTPTGHGFENALNCAEFCEKNYDVQVNGAQFHVFTQSMWRDDCGMNPIYPQGGTWLYDRANWCPGLEAHCYKHELTPYITFGDTFELDMDIETYNYVVPAGKVPANYQIAAQLVSYGEYNYQNEAELVTIIAPNSKDNYLRFNPICKNPKVEVLNNGEKPITSILFNYGLENDPTVYTYLWSGNITFNTTEIIELPSLIFPTNSHQKMFFVELMEINQNTDEFIENNKKTALVELPKELENQLYFNFKTNYKASETEYYLINQNGDTVTSHKNVIKFQFDTTQLNNSQVYTDSLYLSGGCYELILKDKGKNGLDFWANNDGKGYFVLLDKDEKLIHSIEPDFGTETRYSFYVQENTGISVNAKINIAISPNPASERINVASQDGTLIQKVHIFNNLGQLVYQNVIANTNYVISIAEMPKGLYAIHFITEKGSLVEKLIIE